MGEQKIDVVDEAAQHRVEITDATTADSQQGQDPQTGAGNGSPNAGDATTRADAPGEEAAPEGE